MIIIHVIIEVQKGKEGRGMKYTLKELRARKDLTQREVAEDLGISYQTYNAWEQDISGVAISKVYAVAEYFGVTIDELKWTRGA